MIDQRALLARGGVIGTEGIARNAPRTIEITMADDESPSSVDDILSTADGRAGDDRDGEDTSVCGESLHS
jgi:hypothetical protein